MEDVDSHIEVLSNLYLNIRKIIGSLIIDLRSQCELYFELRLQMPCCQSAISHQQLQCWIELIPFFKFTSLRIIFARIVTLGIQMSCGQRVTSCVWCMSSHIDPVDRHVCVIGMDRIKVKVLIIPQHVLLFNYMQYVYVCVYGYQLLVSKVGMAKLPLRLTLFNS